MLNKIKGVSGKLSWSLVGNMIYALSQWAIITLIARYGNPTDLGVYNIGLAVTAPIVMFFNFQLRLILVTDASNEHSFSQYFSGRIIHMLLAYLVIIPVAFLYGDNIEVIIVILLMGGAKFFESLSDITLGYFQKKGEIEHIGKSQLLRGVYTVSIVGITYILSENIVLAAASLTLVMFLRFLTYDLKKLKNHIEIKVLFNNIYLELIKKAYPLGFTSLIVSLNTNIPRYILDKSMGIEEVGIFSVLYYILIAANMFMVPIMLLIAPKIANEYKNKSRTSFIKLNIKLSLLISIVFFVIFIPINTYSSQLLGFLYGSDYVKYSTELTVLLISLFFGFLIELYNITIVTVRTLKLHLLMNLLVTIITLVSGIILIKDYGLIGATYTILISRVVHFFFSLGLIIYAISKKKLN